MITDLTESRESTFQNDLEPKGKTLISRQEQCLLKDKHCYLPYIVTLYGRSSKQEQVNAYNDILGKF